MNNHQVNGLVFLDFDGVLNHQKFFEERVKNSKIPDDVNEKLKRISINIIEENRLLNTEYLLERLQYNYSQLDLNCIILVDEFCQENNLDIVISSTLRSKGIDFLRILLNEVFGMKTNIIGITPHSEHRFRGLEIKKFLEQYLVSKGIKHTLHHRFKRYVIFDDDSDMCLNQAENYFNIDQFVGITPKIIYKATNFLKSFEL